MVLIACLEPLPPVLGLFPVLIEQAVKARFIYFFLKHESYQLVNLAFLAVSLSYWLHFYIFHIRGDVYRTVSSDLSTDLGPWSSISSLSLFSIPLYSSVFFLFYFSYLLYIMRPFDSFL